MVCAEDNKLDIGVDDEDFELRKNMPDPLTFAYDPAPTILVNPFWGGISPYEKKSKSFEEGQQHDPKTIRDAWNLFLVSWQCTAARCMDFGEIS